MRILLLIEKGAGIGLTLVKELIHLNKGEIKVYSTLNRGTSFEILLPIESVGNKALIV